jgi:hypothetical protein
MLGTSRLAFSATTVPEENGPILKIFSVLAPSGFAGSENGCREFSKTLE